MSDRGLSKILKAQQRFVGRLADVANRLEPRGHERVANSGRKFDVADRRIVWQPKRWIKLIRFAGSAPVQPRRILLISRRRASLRFQRTSRQVWLNQSPLALGAGEMLS